MATVTGVVVRPSWNARRYVFALESETAKTWELELPARIATAIQFPAVFGLTNASVEVFVVPASLLVCCTGAFELPLATLVRETMTETVTPPTPPATSQGQLQAPLPLTPTTFLT